MGEHNERLQPKTRIHAQTRWWRKEEIVAQICTGEKYTIHIFREQGWLHSCCRPEIQERCLRFHQYEFVMTLNNKE